MSKKTGELYKQKNLKVNLSDSQKRIAEWLDNLPDQEIERIEWLIEEIDYIIDCMQLQQSGLTEARHIISKFTLPTKD
jgi:hypothetical protein